MSDGTFRDDPEMMERVRLAVDARCFVGSAALLAPAIADEARRLKEENAALRAANAKLQAELDRIEERDLLSDRPGDDN